jgi:hypothetical protein
VAGSQWNLSISAPVWILAFCKMALSSGVDHFGWACCKMALSTVGGAMSVPTLGGDMVNLIDPEILSDYIHSLLITRFIFLPIGIISI